MTLTTTAPARSMLMERSWVLLVEDCVWFARMLIERLGLAGVIDHVETVAAARHALERRDYGLVILDVRLPDGRGLELMEALARTKSRPAILVCTAHFDAADNVYATKLGAQYVVKLGGEDIVAPELVEALGAIIVRVARRRRPLVERLLATARTLATRAGLTTTQALVLELIALGADRDEIAAQRGIGLDTAKNHIKAVLARVERITHACSTAALMLWIMRRSFAESLGER